MPVSRNTCRLSLTLFCYILGLEILRIKWVHGLDHKHHIQKWMETCVDTRHALFCWRIPYLPPLLVLESAIFAFLICFQPKCSMHNFIPPLFTNKNNPKIISYPMRQANLKLTQSYLITKRTYTIPLITVIFLFLMILFTFLTMSTDNDVLLSFLEREKENSFVFPVILKTQHSMNSTKYDTLRRNIPLDRSHHSHYHHKRDARLVTKRGRVQVYFKRISNKSVYYAKDLWNTLVNMQWRWLILIVTVVNTLAYCACAVLFYFDSWVSGDSEINDGLDNSTLCMIGTKNFVEYFMLGIETMTTTGYGYLHPTEYCQLFVVVLTFSTLTSIAIDGAFVSVVYAKLNRPKENNIYGPIFSKKAVISLRSNKLCLLVKINDRDGRHWIDTDVHMYLIKEIMTDEGDTISNYITELDIKPFGMLFWPVEIVHVIGPVSPLWDVSAEELMTTKLEIILVISGSSVKTGQPTKSQTSYLNKEIMWGCQFAQCLEYDLNKQEYLVDKKLFHQTVPQEVPLCSAKVLEELRRETLLTAKDA